jgi:hypothetical protein
VGTIGPDLGLSKSLFSEAIEDEGKRKGLSINDK